MTSTTTVANAAMQTQHSDPIQAEFRYWATSRSPDPAEALSIVNGTCADIQTHVSLVTDIHADYAKYNLEDHAFQIIKHDSALLPPHRKDFDFTNLELVTAEYWPDLQALVKAQLRSRSVVVLHSVVRHSSSQPHADPYKRAQSLPSLVPSKPFHVVHNDYSASGSRTVLRAMLSSFFEDTASVGCTTEEERKEFFALRDEILEVEKQDIAASNASSHLDWNGANYTGPRWAIFSLWRSLDTVLQDPLAIIDPNSLFTTHNDNEEKGKSYMPVRLTHLNRAGFLPKYEITNMMPLAPRPGQEYKWYWMRNQQPNEVYAIKLFDSEAWKEGSCVMPCAPHSAFTLPDTITLPLRKSIETRVLVVW